MTHNYFLILFFLLAGFSLSGQEINISKKNLLKLSVLKSPDLLFTQYEEQVRQSYKNMSSGKNIEHIFYTYTALKDDTVLSLSARLNISQESLITLNSLSGTDSHLEKKQLIIPVNSGFYIKTNAETSYELLLYKNHAGEYSNAINYNIDGTVYYFLPNKRASQTEKAFLLDTAMKPPLSKSILTSSFGYRVSPISGDWKFHSGLDLASPEGSSVFACKSGKVTAASYNSTYGNYIIILHANNMTSVYAHLSSIQVKKDEIVSSGQIIGKVGSTGTSTGPHLHFEVRFSGNPTDPGKLINLK